MASPIKTLMFVISPCNDKYRIKISWGYHLSIKSYELFNFTKFCMEINENLRSHLTFQIEIC